MKTKRRHELETNQLADWLGAMMERLRPRANLILTGAVILLIALLAASFLMRRSRSRSQAAWTALATAATPTELAAVSDDYPGTPAGNWAMLRSADVEFAMGMQQLLRNREQALVSLRAAERSYERLAAGSPESPLVDERASMGLAKTLEALGEVERAKEAYQAVLDRFPNGLFATEAGKRIEDLKDPKIAEFYAWLEEQGSETASQSSAIPAARAPQTSSSNTKPTLNPLAPTLPLIKPDLSAPEVPDKTQKPAETDSASDESDTAASKTPVSNSSEPAADKKASDSPTSSPGGSQATSESPAKPSDKAAGSDSKGASPADEDPE